MSFTEILEPTEQALAIQTALEALSTVMTIMLCVTIAAFIVYLISIFYLCREEIRSATARKQIRPSHYEAALADSEIEFSDLEDGRTYDPVNISRAEAQFIASSGVLRSSR